MAEAVFNDKVGGKETLEVRPGQTVRDLLRANGIPANAVITHLNGEIVSEDAAVVGPDDYVEFWQARHYDLGVTRRPKRRVYSTPNPIYTKSVLYDDAGDVEVRSEQLDRFGFVEYVERTFVESVKLAELVDPGVEIVTGLSGGRDSVSFLKLLERTRDQLPPFQMVAVTVTGTPDWEEPETFQAARLACEGLGIEQVLVTADEINQTFRLIRPYVEVVNEILASESAGLNMVIGHHTLRRMIELEAERRGAKTIALGFNADDLLASLVTWFTSGFQMGPIPRRPIGPYSFIFPLFRITKKELTLYLEMVAPELNRQGSPGRFTTGPGERSMAYAIADHLLDLWPGIDYYAFEAFANMQKYVMPGYEYTCSVCGAVSLQQEGVPNPGTLCDVCSLFARLEYSSTR
jgi:tRNA(Ile)-lysidine synthase TilS/MesJ/sulfur carrier protein ThiS